MKTLSLAHKVHKVDRVGAIVEANQATQVTRKALQVDKVITLVKSTIKRRKSSLNKRLPSRSRCVKKLKSSSSSRS